MVTLVGQDYNSEKEQKLCRRLLETKQKKTNKHPKPVKKSPFLLLCDSSSHPSHSHKQAVFDHACPGSVILQQLFLVHFSTQKTKLYSCGSFLNFLFH